jgi:hypothetical protein
MAIAKASFEWNGAKITVQKPNGFSQTRLWRLHQLINALGTEDIEKRDAVSMSFYLANTLSVEGNVGFPVPIADVTHNELLAFVRGLGEADAELLRVWDGAISEAMVASNDPDLLPPDELDQKKSEDPHIQFKRLAQRRQETNWMRQFLSNNPPTVQDIEAALVDFGFYHLASDRHRMYAEYVNHGNYGYAGGVMDQPEEYWRDMDTMRWLELWIKHVAAMPRLEQVSVFDTLREKDRLDGSWKT